MANSALEAGGTSRRSGGEGGRRAGVHRLPGVDHRGAARGQKEAVGSSSTPQLTQ